MNDNMATVTTTTTTTTSSFFPSLRGLIDQGRDLLIRNDDWLLLDEILFETSANAAEGREAGAEGRVAGAEGREAGAEGREAGAEGEEGSARMPAQLPTLTSLGIGSGSNRCRKIMLSYV